MKHFYLKALGILALLLPNYIALAQNQIQRTTDPFTMTIANPGRMVIGDFDKDGDTDILYQNGTTAGTGIGFMKNNGGGIYQDFPDATAAGSPFAGFSFAGENISPTALFVFDYDNDGDVDILDRDNGADPATTMGIWRNENGTSFSELATPFTAATWTTFFPRMIAGDFDNDGDKDILFQAGNTMGIGFGYIRNNGGGSFTTFDNANSPATPFTAFLFLTQQMIALTVVDYDNDGDVDIIDRDGGLGVWKNNGGIFLFDPGPFTTLDVGTTHNRILFGDFDADGDQDVLFQKEAVMSTGFGYASNNGSGIFTISPNATTAAGPFNGFDFINEQLSNLFVFDYDNDGDADIIDRDNFGVGGQTGVWRQVGPPPLLISTSPLDNATNVSSTANIVLTFSEAVTKNTGNIYLYNTTTNSLVTSLAIGSPSVTTTNNLSWTIDFPDDFTSNGYYAIRLDANLFRDSENRGTAAITDTTTFNFFVPGHVPPVITTLNGDVAIFTEGGAAAKLDAGGNATASDNSPDFNGAILVANFTANHVNGQDILGIENQGTGPGQIGISGGNVTIGGTIFATFTGGISPAPLVIIMNSAASHAAVTALLRALTYSNNSNNANTNVRSISIALTDTEVLTATANVTASITLVNNPPILTAPDNITVKEDESKLLTGISFTDPDGANGAARVSFLTASGTFIANPVAGITITGNNSSTLILDGTYAALNSYLSGASNVAFAFPANQSSFLVINVLVSDLGNTGGGAQTADKNIQLLGAEVNDRPTITAPASINVIEDLRSPLSGFSFSDIDAGIVDVTLSVPASNGTISTQSMAGITINTVSANEVKLTGILTALNSYISTNNVHFTTALSNTATVALTVTINDGGSTGEDPGTSGTPTNEESTAVIDLVVEGVNDAPTISGVFDQSTLMNITKVLDPFSVSDVDAGNGILNMRLEAYAGLLNLPGTTGLTFIAGDGTADAIMEFTGTLTNINAALHALNFVPPASFVGDINITLRIDDLGNTPGIPFSEIQTLVLHVLPTTPDILHVSSSTANGTYKLGDAIEVTVTFDQPVNVTGTPVIMLETGTTDRAAAYTSGSGTSTLFFNYTVESGDESSDLDYTATNALMLNGGTIRNGSLLDAVLNLPATGSANSIAGSKNLVIDGSAPVITSVTVPANATYVAGQVLSFALSFSKVITVTGNASSITIQLESGPVQATYVSGSGSNVLLYRYVVVTDNLDTDGITLGNLTLNGATLQDAAGNNAVLTLNNVPVTTGVRIDAAAPVVTSVMVPADKIWKEGEVLSFTVNFNEAVIKDGATDPYILLTIGETQVQLIYVSGSGTNAYLFRYTVKAGDLDRNGIEIGPSIRLNGATLKDAAGNDAKTGINNAGSLVNVWVDAVPPVVTAGQVFSIAENSAAGTAVGTVLGTDPGSTGTLQQWTITSNVNPDGDGNPAFAINANTGAITVNDAGDLNFEATASLAISVTVSDGLNTSTAETVRINLTNVSEAPTDIALSNNTILENNQPAAQVGLLSSTSSETGATFTYTLAAGGADNSAFTISGNSLRAAAAFNAEAKSTYNIRIRSTAQNGEFFEKAFVITVTNVNEPPTLDVITDRPYCATTAEVIIPLAGITPGPETTQNTTVTVSSNNPALFTQLTADNTAIRLRIAAAANGNATITVTVKDNGGTANNGIDQVVRSFNVSVTTMTAPVITSNKGTTMSKGIVAALTATGGVSYVWDNSPGIISGQNSNVLNIRPLQNATYRVTASNAAGCSASAQIAIEVVDDHNVNSANMMSPNGDGINERFVIQNIDSYPNNELKIFDRSGRLIYNKRGYQNEWDGKMNGRVLEEGTYYFLLDFGPGQPKVKGFITIIRDK
ncbi:T9SS type B sorting domain-containing protein [Chitinophaga sp. SYP-B3965]|uniref:T9SS type B sorting domain-containing protein n=1 Tax=Chitinophaga sp. SYP-B3965 TaxID=2663120 RepID=UPI001299A0D1|nr:gliding motility-associated C-terminal domain-containing protein [Chitinophaga sp. SYP-B3965]MRG46699.1 T9SS type B sorting domain-containing protein [Chitinophaga sp. SYP-B3965]